jgi:MEMO1 family protein
MRLRRKALIGTGIVWLVLSICTLMPACIGAGASTPSDSAAGPASVRVRRPAVAGLFYPAEPRALSNDVMRLLNAAPVRTIPRLRALVCPHAGYTYSGEVAAAGYKQLVGRDIERVVVLGPSHYAAFEGVSVPDAAYYETPLGRVRISAVAAKLTGKGPFVLEPRCRVQRPSWWRQAPRSAPQPGEDTPETWEHSVEVQFPFLQLALTNFEAIPAIYGEADPAAVARVLAELLDEKTIIVASSDLSHYHGYEAAKGLDGRCIKAICDMDIEKMKDQEACGKSPVLALLHVARLKGWKAQLLRACSSGDTPSGDKDRVVGYAAVAFYSPEQQAFGSEERAFMLGLARRTLATVVTNGSLPEIPPAQVTANLSQKRGCFVTLTKGGALRGCIGHILPQEPLYRAVIDNARNAAVRDPRFPPLQRDEVEQIHIEISVLSEPQPLEFSSPDDLLNKLQPDIDGVVLQIGPRMATFLPQVWAQIPAKEDFLSQLSRKAGCESRAWRGKETSVSIYHVESFEESSNPAHHN